MAARAVARAFARVGRRPPGLRYMDAATIMERPSVPQAMRLLQDGCDPAHGWAVFQRVLCSQHVLDPAFFEQMLQFCQRYDPSRVVDVMNVAVSRGGLSPQAIDTLFSAFLVASHKAKPPPVAYAFELYSKHDVLHTSTTALNGLVSLCRVANDASSAFPLLDDALKRNLTIGPDLFASFALCCAESGSAQGADVAEKMLDDDVSTQIRFPRQHAPFGHLVQVLIAHHRLESAVRVLDVMETLTIPNRDRQAAVQKVLVALAKATHVPLMMLVFRAMKVGAVPGVLSAMITAAGRAFDGTAVATLHRYASETGMLGSDPIVTRLMSSYELCMNLDACDELFRGAASAPAYTAMIAAYSNHGLLDKAIATFGAMQEARLRPTKETLLALLSGCRKVADLERAQAILADFARTWQIHPGHVHANCMVDLYARVDDLDAAERFVAGQATFNDSVSCWARVLRACRKKHDVERAERVFARILGIPCASPEARAPSYALMASVYARARRLSDLSRLRAEMTSMRVPVPDSRPTVTSLLLDDRRIDFLSGDAEQPPGAVEQHSMMIDNLLSDGYTVDTSVVWADADASSTEDRARASVLMHGEKLAVAYALMRPGPASGPIRLTTRAPLCLDCHDALRRVSSLYDRPIFVFEHDKRPHRFIGGQCSCGD
ncbi:DYW domain-containing protein [Plasmodiophora brassicae]